MDKEDGRKLGVEALRERRKTIIRMKQNGCCPLEIVHATGCSRQAIYPTWNRWKSGRGQAKEEVFCIRKRGTKLGQYRTLTPQQEK
jgi:DNA invertase Pin-like site-specific DNA recombinase